MRLCYDFETNGLFADTIRPGTKDASIISRVHCLVTQDMDTGEVCAYHDDPTILPWRASLRTGVNKLLSAEVRYAHNGSLFDERVIREFFTDLWLAADPLGIGMDTQAATAAIWPTEHLRRLDAARIARAKIANKKPFPAELLGRHSLEAWGARLGNRKAEYDGGWKTFTAEMLRYCIQDVSTLRALVQKIDKKIADNQFSLRAWELEQDFKVVMSQQTVNGFRFDREAADKLTAELQVKRAELATYLEKSIPPFENHYLTEVKKIPKVKIVPFNPGSKSHIARHLMERHGWKPNPREGYTPDGQVKVDESVLEELRQYPNVDKMIEYKTIQKVLGMLAEPKKKDGVPWVKMVAADGRIHGQVDHNGAVTSRCTHRKPNMTQVPKVGNPYGAESRALFIPSEGNVLVGVDASGLELRMLGHYLAKYDGGEYANEVVKGDVHKKNQRALDIPDGPTARDTAKRSIYAELYGAGEVKLGKTIDPTLSPREQKARGRAAKASLLANTVGLRALKERCAILHKKFQSVNLPDGRRAPTREDYSALNTLLQASGAIIMKLAVVLMHRRFVMEGLFVKQVHQAHDEVQLDVRPEIAEQVKAIGCWAIQQAGVELGIKCELKGEAKTGRTWAETH